jgi:CheY-like chemotaxis protein
VLKVLIVEDDLMIADLAEETLLDGGYQVCGIARIVADAVALALQHNPDFALLDLRLADGGFGTEIAAKLMPLRKIGVIFVTGNVAQVKLTSADGHASLTKPYRSIDLLRSLEIVAALLATGVAPKPFPPGFHLLEPAAAISPAVQA